MEIFAGFSDGLPVWIDLIARASALLGLAALMTWGFRTRAASTRHLLWTTTFVLLIALPFAVRWLPTLDLTVLPSPTAASSSELVAAEPTDATEPGVSDRGALGSASIPTVSLSPSLIRLLLLMWGIGSLGSLVSLGVGWALFVTLAREGQTIYDPEWLQSVESLRRDLGIRRTVRLIKSRKAQTPMVGGLFRASVLLPASAEHWPVNRRIAVLTHELIHVRRHDPLRQMLTGVALAPYWFHPLSWLAARLSAVTREQACDEGVLELGAQPSEYAGHLLELAELPGSPPIALALPLIQRSQLEKRIVAILAPGRPGPSLAVASVLCTLLFVCGIVTAVSQPISDAEALRKACQLHNPIPD